MQAHRLSRAKACRIVGYSRSACYQPTVDWAVKDAPVIDALNTIIAKRPRWGFWKCFKRLRKDGKPWNHKRVHRVYCDMKLNMKRRTKKRAITRERQPLGILFVEWAESKGIALLYIQPGKPNQNAFVERFNRSFRDEVLDANLFNTISQAQEAADAWVADYNGFRPHDSLGDMTPMEFRSRAFKPRISSFCLCT